MNKGLTITLIILLSLMVAIISGALVFMINTDFNFDNFSFINSYSTELVEEKEIENIKDFDIKTNMADIVIEEYDNSNIKVELYSNYVKNHEITEEESIKVILEDKKSSVFGFGRKNAVVKIFVPKGYSNNIKIDSKVGDVIIKSVKNASLELKANTGDVTIDEINNASIIIQTGDVKVESVNTLITDITTGDTKVEKANELTLKTKTGDIKVDSVNKIVSSTTTGDIKINNVNASLDITSNTGDVKIEKATINENSKITSGVGDVKIEKATGFYVSGTSKIGDVRINNNNNDRKSDYELIITSRVGDIKVN